MFFAEEENKKLSLWAAGGKSHSPAGSTLHWQKGNLSLSSPGQDLHKVSRFKLHDSGVPGRRPAQSPSQSPKD